MSHWDLEFGLHVRLRRQEQAPKNKNGPAPPEEEAGPAGPTKTTKVWTPRGLRGVRDAGNRAERFSANAQSRFAVFGLKVVFAVTLATALVLPNFFEAIIAAALCGAISWLVTSIWFRK